MTTIDKDVAAMMASLKKYDTLNESAQKVDVPAAQRKASGDPDWKLTQGDLDAKTSASKPKEKSEPEEKTGLAKYNTARRGKVNEQECTENEDEEPDQEVMEWIERLKKTGR